MANLYFFLLAFGFYYNQPENRFMAEKPVALAMW